jgi:hypothetical protein
LKSANSRENDDFIKMRSEVKAGIPDPRRVLLPVVATGNPEISGISFLSLL